MGIESLPGFSCRVEGVGARAESATDDLPGLCKMEVGQDFWTCFGAVESVSRADHR
jgi:hypothetical protein